MSAFRGDGRGEWTGRCAQHPDIAASFTCPRCGDHGCESCARQAIEGATPLCPTCYRRRQERVQTLKKDDGSQLPLWSIGLGVLALVPLLWPFQLGAVLLGVTALRRLDEGAPRRSLAWVGIALGILGAFGTCLTFGLVTS